MPTTFTTADAEIKNLIKSVIGKRYQAMEGAVTVDCIVAFAARNNDGELTGAVALNHHGYPAAALIKINGLKDRVRGMADATIFLDGDRWPDLSAEEQIALIDHELYHLEIVTKDGHVVTDDLNRPKLKLRKHDFEVGGFYEIIERYKEDALELQEVSAVVQKLKQGTFPDWG